MANDRVTQTPAEVVGLPDEPEARVTQAGVEVVANPPPPPTPGRVADVGVEALQRPDQAASRVTQAGAEVVMTSGVTGRGRVTLTALEVVSIPARGYATAVIWDGIRA
jgi:hypothetical protein